MPFLSSSVRAFKKNNLGTKVINHQKYTFNMADRIILNNEKSKVIHLEKYFSKHTKLIYSILDKEIGEMMGWEIRKTSKELENHLNKDNLKFWSIFLNNNLVGGIFLDLTIKETNVWSKRIANIGYFIDSKYRRKGCISASVPWVIDYAFKILKIQRLKAGHLETNVASRKIIEKNGFKLVGIERNYAKPFSSKKYLNHYLYDLILEDLSTYFSSK